MNDAFPDPGQTLEVDPPKLFALRRRDPEAFLLIDCREPEEHEFCRIGGAERLIPLSRFAEEIAGEPPEMDLPIVIYCHHGMRSAQAAQFLRSRGWDRTFSLRGGIDLWSEQIDPSVPQY